MSKEKWWVIAGPESGWVFEERPNGDHVVVNNATAEEHVLHGYTWMHVESDSATGPKTVKVLGEGPPPFAKWVELSQD